MRKILFAVVAVALSGAAFANEGSSTFEPRHGAGHYNLGGSMSFDKSTAAGAKMTYELSPTVRYFVIDKLAVGGVASYQHMASGNIFDIGPSVAYHFWGMDHLSTYVAGTYLFGVTDTSPDSVMQAALGAEWFLTDSLAFGPAFYYQSAKTASVSDNNFGMRFEFGLYF